jgi:hypothetical protein
MQDSSKLGPLISRHTYRRGSYLFLGIWLGLLGPTFAVGMVLALLQGQPESGMAILFVPLSLLLAYGGLVHLLDFFRTSIEVYEEALVEHKRWGEVQVIPNGSIHGYKQMSAKSGRHAATYELLHEAGSLKLNSLISHFDQLDQRLKQLTRIDERQVSIQEADKN